MSASFWPTRRSVLASSAAVSAVGLLHRKSGAAAADDAIRPFRVDVADEQLMDLRRRIAATRWSDRETVMLLRYGLAIVLALGATACEVGAPDRASAIQNVNAISDDIAAVRMTHSPSRVQNPNSSIGSISAYSPYKDYGRGPQLP